MPRLHVMLMWPTAAKCTQNCRDVGLLKKAAQKSQQKSKARENASLNASQTPLRATQRHD